MVWQITISASNPENVGCLPSRCEGTRYALGIMDHLVRPPPVPRGAAALASRAERAELFSRMLLKAATDHIGEAVVAMPVHASARGS